MKRGTLFFGLFLLSLPANSSIHAQQADKISTEHRLQKVEEALRALAAQVEELNSRLRPQQAPGPVETLTPALELSLTGAPRKGSRASKFVVVEFSDFQCPFCARHAQAAYEQIQKEYVNTGKVQYMFRHFPLEHIHPLARRAAEAAICADEQGKFWEFHDRLFLNQQALTPESLKTHATNVHIDSFRFETCLAQPDAGTRVTQDVSDARRLGLRATPAFIIGELQADGTVRALRRIVGAQPYEVFKLALDSLMVPSP